MSVCWCRCMIGMCFNTFHHETTYLSGVCRYTSSLALHRSIHDLVAAESVSDNELRLQYRIDSSPPFDLTIGLIFEPTTRKLASVAVSTDPEDALEGLGFPENAMDEIIGVNVQRNDPHNVVSAIVARVRGGQQ